MLLFSGCKTPGPKPEPKPVPERVPEKPKKQSFVPPTAEQAYRCKTIAPVVVADNQADRFADSLEAGADGFAWGSFMWKYRHELVSGDKQ